MDPNAASAPSLISSLELMIQASVNSALDRRLGPAPDTLDAQLQAAVAAALDKRLVPAVGSLGNRLTSIIEQRLGNAVGIVDHRVEKSVTAGLEQRLGPAGSALTAQITFTPAPFSDILSVPQSKARVLGEIAVTKETNAIYPAVEQVANVQPVDNGGSKEKEEPTEKQGTNELEASKMPTPDSVDELSVHAATSAKGNEPTIKKTRTIKSGTHKGAIYPLFVDSASKRKTSTSDSLTVKISPRSPKPFSSADGDLAKGKANQKSEANKVDDPGESDSLPSEEESEKEKPKRKRPKVKLDPPGYTNGPAIKFRRISPKLTASAKSRGFPRVIELKDFTEASNKENLTMADVVATVLFEYDPMSLEAFVDKDNYPTFHFIRKESDRKARNFVIERRRESYGGVVKVSGVQLVVQRNEIDSLRQCGYHLSQVERAKYRSDASRTWDTKYEYIILPCGRWVASNYTQDPIVSNSSKRTIEQWATEFGTKVFLEKLWVESSEAKIESDRLILP